MIVSNDHGIQLETQQLEAETPATAETGPNSELEALLAEQERYKQEAQNAEREREAAEQAKKELEEELERNKKLVEEAKNEVEECNKRASEEESRRKEAEEKINTPPVSRYGSNVHVVSHIHAAVEMKEVLMRKR